MTLDLLLKTAPIWTLVLVGAVLPRSFAIDRKSISLLLIYFLIPVVSFVGVAKVRVVPSDIGLVGFSFMLCLGTALLLRWPFGGFVDTRTRNLVITISSVPNAGFFGLPIVMVLFGEEAFMKMVLIATGVGIFSNSIGFYLVARQVMSVRSAASRVLRVPSIYAVALGILFSMNAITLHPAVLEFQQLCKATYTVLAMLLIGLAVPRPFPSMRTHLKVVGGTVFGKYLVMPAVALVLIALDHTTFNVLTHTSRTLVLLTAFMPPGLNTLTFALLLDIETDIIAALVTGGAIASFVLIPFLAL